MEEWKMRGKIVRKLAAAGLSAVVAVSASVPVFAADKSYSISEIGDMNISLPEDITVIDRNAPDSAEYFKLFGLDYNTVMSQMDSNNVYIWYITNFEDVDDINYDQMIQRCKSMMIDIKDLCHEPVLLPAIPIRCEISSVDENSGRQFLAQNGNTTVPTIRDETKEDEYYDASWLEVRINDDYSISSYEVVERICSLLTYFFSVKNGMVGFGSFNTNDILNLIMEKIPAVSDIYTVYQEKYEENPIYTHGISMATFSTNTSLINLGDDLQVKTGHIGLEPFMYPVLYTNTEEELKKRIRIVNKNINILSRNNY